MPNDPAVDGSVNAVAERIHARRMAGQAPTPEGPAPEGMKDGESDYSPSQNLHTDDERPEQVTAEQLRDAALGEDSQEAMTDEPGDDLGQDPAEALAEDVPTDADEAGDEGIELNFESLDELAELIGMDVDEFYSQIKMGTVVDGEVGSVTLADLRKGHQLESSFTRKNQAFVEKVKSFEAEQEEKRTQINDHFARSTTALNIAQQQLAAEFQGVDWNSLQATNPAEYQAKRQQYGERQQQLNQAMQHQTQQMKMVQQQQEQAQAEAKERHLDEQHNLLMAAVPAWRKDENRRAREGAKVAEHLVKEFGYTPDEIANCEDHRLILLGRAALGLDGPSKRKLEITKKKIAETSNLVKPGSKANSRTTGNAAFTKKAQDAAATLRKTGSTDDAAKAILARKLARQASAKRGRRSRV